MPTGGFCQHLRRLRESPNAILRYSNSLNLHCIVYLDYVYHTQVKSLQSSIDILRRKIMSLSEKNSVSVDDTLHADLCCLMEEHQAVVMSANADDGSFSHIFWQQQMEASRQHDTRTMCWHPLMIKWCLHLRLKSSGAYREL